MPYVRVALVIPKPEHSAQVRRLQHDLLRFDRTLPGFLEGYFIEAGDDSGRLGRLIFWQAKADADHAAQQPHTLSLRATLLALIEEGPAAHVEAGLEATSV